MGDFMRYKFIVLFSVLLFFLIVPSYAAVTPPDFVEVKYNQPIIIGNSTVTLDYSGGRTMFSLSSSFSSFQDSMIKYNSWPWMADDGSYQYFSLYPSYLSYSSVSQIQFGAGMSLSVEYYVPLDDYIKSITIPDTQCNFMILSGSSNYPSWPFSPLIDNKSVSLTVSYIDSYGHLNDLYTESDSSGNVLSSHFVLINDFVSTIRLRYTIVPSPSAFRYDYSVDRIYFGVSLTCYNGYPVTFVPLTEFGILRDVLSQLDDIAASLGTDVNTLLREILAAIQGQTDYTPQLQAILDALKSLSLDNGTTVEQLAKILSQLKDLTDVTEAGWQAPSGDLVDSELFTEVMDELIDHIDDLNQQIAADTVRPPPDQLRPAVPDALNPTDETARTSLGFVGEIFANPLILSMLTVIFTLAIVRLVFFGRSNK